MVNVGKYTSPMVRMGIESSIVCFYQNHSDLTRPGPPNGRVGPGNPPTNGLISGKSRLVKYYNLARIFREDGFCLNK